MHKPGWLKTALGDVEHNELRVEIEHMVRDRLGLDCIINVVPNSRRQIAGLFVGDMVAAHLAGVQFARQVYATEMPDQPVDVAICNAYPKDTEFLQHGLALNVLASAPRPVVKEGGTIVVVTASPEGRGYHALYGPGMRYDRLREQGDRGTRSAASSPVYFSPNLSPADARSDALFRRWEDLIACLEARHGPGASAAVFPCASIQLASRRQDP